MHKENIVCAAIHYDDWSEIVHNCKNIKSWVVISWYRHSHCYWVLWRYENLKDVDHKKVDQWFLTSQNRYVWREEALKIVLWNNQELRTPRERLKKVKILFSEDLY
jgi:hypothetical protein